MLANAGLSLFFIFNNFLYILEFIYYYYLSKNDIGIFPQIPEFSNKSEGTSYGPFIALYYTCISPFKNKICKIYLKVNFREDDKIGMKQQGKYVALIRVEFICFREIMCYLYSKLSKPNVTQLNSKQVKSNFIGLDSVVTWNNNTPPPQPHLHHKLLSNFQTSQRAEIWHRYSLGQPD